LLEKVIFYLFPSNTFPLKFMYSLTANSKSFQLKSAALKREHEIYIHEKKKRTWKEKIFHIHISKNTSSRKITVSSLLDPGTGLIFGWARGCARAFDKLEGTGGGSLGTESSSDGAKDCVTLSKWQSLQTHESSITGPQDWEGQYLLSFLCFLWS